MRYLSELKISNFVIELEIHPKVSIIFNIMIINIYRLNKWHMIEKFKLT